MEAAADKDQNCSNCVESCEDDTEGGSNNTQLLVIATDDHNFMLRILEAQVTGAGYRFQGYTNPNEAVKRVIKESPYAFITDYLFPDTTGDKVLLAVKKRLPYLPCIVITAYATKQTVAQLRKVGRIDRIFSKPWKDHLLLEALGEIKRSSPFVSSQRSMALHNILLRIKTQAHDLELDYVALNDLLIDIQTIDIQLKSTHPKVTVIVECLDSIVSGISNTAHQELGLELEESVRSFFDADYLISCFNADSKIETQPS